MDNKTSSIQFTQPKKNKILKISKKNFTYNCPIDFLPNNQKKESTQTIQTDLFMNQFGSQ